MAKTRKNYDESDKKVLYNCGYFGQEMSSVKGTVRKSDWHIQKMEVKQLPIDEM